VEPMNNRSEVRWSRWVASSLLVTAAVSALAAVSCTTAEPEAAAMTAEQKVERGHYISIVASCNDCHTPGHFYGNPDTLRTLSGSELGWEGPWGVSYPRNLTPDMETGIGKWSEDDIVTAVRTGHRPDQSPLLPPMPWPNYAFLTDEDAYALAAYLKSLPPIQHKAPAVIPPGTQATGPRFTLPPPPAWDSQHMTPPAETAKQAG